MANLLKTAAEVVVIDALSEAKTLWGGPCIRSAQRASGPMEPAAGTAVNDLVTTRVQSAYRRGKPLLCGGQRPMGSVAEPNMGKELAQTMVERIMGTTSHAEALRKLRSAFPESPLAMRVAALALLTHRNASDHIPR